MAKQSLGASRATSPTQEGVTQGLIPGMRLLILALATCGLMAFYLFYGIGGNLGFILQLRGTKLLTFLVVGTGIGLATVLFHIATQNQILTPSMLGFDALYVFIATAAIYFFGASGISGFNEVDKFLMNTGVMVLAAVLLFQWLLRKNTKDLYVMLLVGIVLGTVLRTAAAFLKQLLNPNDFLVLQDYLFANFSRPQTSSLLISAVVVAAALIGSLILSPSLDVLGLGRENAINLGMNYRVSLRWILVTVALLTACATALVGPIIFLGLLAAQLAYHSCHSYRMRVVIPSAALWSTAIIILGQIISERFFNSTVPTGIIVEFIGGVTFLILLLRYGKARA